MLLLQDTSQEWLHEGHLAQFISDAIDGLDLDAFHVPFDKDGQRNQTFHPALMVKVLNYGYASGVSRSGKIAKKLHEDVALRVLAATVRPRFAYQTRVPMDRRHLPSICHPGCRPWPAPRPQCNARVRPMSRLMSSPKGVHGP